LRVLLLSHHFHPNWGGTESYAYLLARYLNRDGYPTSVYSYGKNIDSGKKGAGTEFRILKNVLHTSSTSSEYVKPFLMGLQQVTDIYWLHMLRKDFDLLHIQGLTRGFEIIVRNKESRFCFKGWAYFTGTPKIVTFHEYIREGNLKRYVQEANWCDAVICNNKDSALMLEKKIAEDKVHFIPNGIDVEMFDPTKFKDEENQYFRVFCPSRITRMKGILELVKAAEILVNEYRLKDIRFLLIGEDGLSPGYYEPQFLSYIRNQIASLGLKDFFEFMEGRPYFEMPELYSKTNVVVLPSHDEGFGLTILEGMAMKRPVIATSIDPIPDILTNGKEGITIPKGNPKKLAEAILQLYQDPGLRRTMGDAGRHKVERDYDFGKIVREIESVYENVCAIRGCNPESLA
jgi:glycosyltransferase involved in cell wall biosynthesis